MGCAHTPCEHRANRGVKRACEHSPGCAHTYPPPPSQEQQSTECLRNAHRARDGMTWPLEAGDLNQAARCVAVLALARAAASLRRSHARLLAHCLRLPRPCTHTTECGSLWLRSFAWKSCVAEQTVSTADPPHAGACAQVGRFPSDQPTQVRVQRQDGGGRVSKREAEREVHRDAQNGC